MKDPDVSVIISTYNQPEWLRKVLWGYNQQTYKNVEVIVADDGSDTKTSQLIESLRKEVFYPIKHVWQEDSGFQKTKILNKAILETSTDYLIFTDGDCIPRQDFVASHLNKRRLNCFLSGGYFKLPEQTSNLITKEHIDKQNCFEELWLIKHGVKKSFKMNKLRRGTFKTWFLNTFTTTKATFDGMNASAWKKDIINVNGFDERMTYGGEDRELGERLMNMGVRPIQARYSLVCLHLYHERPYKNNISLSKNNAIRKSTKQNKTVFTEFGLVKN